MLTDEQRRALVGIAQSDGPVQCCETYGYGIFRVLFDAGLIYEEGPDDYDVLPTPACRLLAAEIKAHEETKRECRAYRERLQFDPGGSDKIDELEEAMQFSRHECDTLRAQLDEARAVLREFWSADNCGQIPSHEAINRLAAILTPDGGSNG